MIQLKARIDFQNLPVFCLLGDQFSVTEPRAGKHRDSERP